MASDSLLVVGTLKTRAFVNADFREPLLVGSLAIQRASRQDFALFNRNVVGIIALSDGTRWVRSGVCDLKGKVKRPGVPPNSFQIRH